MKFITIRTFLLVTYAMKVMLFPIDSKEIIFVNDPISSKKQQLLLSKFDNKKNEILMKTNSVFVDKKVKEDLSSDKISKEKGFDLDNLIMNLDVTLKLIRDIKGKTLDYTKNKKNLRSSSDFEADLAVDYVNTAEKVQNSLYNIDTSQISSINGKKINTAANLKFKDLITIAMNSQSKDKLYHFDNFKFFDNHISILMASILAGGLMGILVVACISIKHEDNFEKRLYSKY